MFDNLMLICMENKQKLEKFTKVRGWTVASQVATIFENLRFRGSKMELLMKKMCMSQITNRDASVLKISIWRRPMKISIEVVEQRNMICLLFLSHDMGFLERIYSERIFREMFQSENLKHF